MSSITEPQVGQLWVGQSTGFDKEIVGVSPDIISIKVIGSGYESNRVYPILRRVFLDNNVPKGLSQEEFNALRTLEAKGYTVAPPPEKKKGKAYIYKSEGAEYGWFASVYSPQERKGYGARDVLEPIAIIDWEEGQGL